jgi:hypothetical protein
MRTTLVAVAMLALAGCGSDDDGGGGDSPVLKDYTFLGGWELRFECAEGNERVAFEITSMKLDHPDAPDGYIEFIDLAWIEGPSNIGECNDGGYGFHATQQWLTEFSCRGLKVELSDDGTDASARALEWAPLPSCQTAAPTAVVVTGRQR